MQNLVLITGGAKSGKSEFAESLACAGTTPVIFLATMASAGGDAEMAEKIKRHQQRRPASWQTIEVGNDPISAIMGVPAEPVVFLLDCLSLYIASLLCQCERQTADPIAIEAKVLDRSGALLALICRRPEATFIVVTNEVGSGIVPDYPLGRIYRDVLGAVNQEFARQAATVWLSCVGLQIKLKGPPAHN